MLSIHSGESHGQALLAFVSGLPAGVPVDVEAINHELHRRQLGYGRGGRQKIEKDRADIFAGVRHGKTIGAPIALRIENRDWRIGKSSAGGRQFRRRCAVEEVGGAAAGSCGFGGFAKNLIFMMRGMCWSGLQRGRLRRGWRQARLPGNCWTVWD